MNIRAIKPQSGERFACSARDVRAAFAGTSVDWVGFGRPTRSFLTRRWNARYYPKPVFVGPVVAALEMHVESELTRFRKLREYPRGGTLNFYPARSEQYPDEASAKFVADVLPMMRSWFDAEMSKPETQFQAKTLVIEWTGGGHKTHEFRIM